MPVPSRLVLLCCAALLPAACAYALGPSDFVLAPGLYRIDDQTEGTGSVGAGLLIRGGLAAA